MKSSSDPLLAKRLCMILQEGTEKNESGRHSLEKEKPAFAWQRLDLRSKAGFIRSDRDLR